MHRSTLRILLFGTTLVFACGDDGSAGGTTSSSPTSETGSTSASTTAADDTTDDTAGDSTSASTGTTGGACQAEQPALVTDIDETLTISDAEFIMQLGDGNYDPVEREGAAALMSAYADLGYHVMYLTARSEQLTVDVTNETAREATERWLEEHGFPTDPDQTTVVLAPSLLLGQDVRDYKADALMEQQAAGLRFDYAYGNATTDIEAYADAGIALDATFIIGEHAGEGGTVAVAGEDWLEHADMHLPGVPAVCEDG
jgi:hypothetical protein